jgi:hypothetical protein
MGGWRDTDGRTAAERRKLQTANDRAHFADALRRRPLGLVKGLAGFVFIVVLALALIGMLR